MILIATALFPPEPVVSANISYDLASFISKSHKVTVISPKPTRPYGVRFDAIPLHTDFEHVVLNSYTHPESSVLGRLRESFSLGLHMVKYIEDNHSEIEVIYANVWPLFAQYLLARVCKKHCIPLVMHVQDVYPESLTNKIPFLGKAVKQILLPIDRYSLFKSTKVIAISNQMKSVLQISRKLNDNSVEVIRNWQDDASFNLDNVYCDAPMICEQDFVFLYLGSISPAAGVDLLIHSFEKSGLKNACLVIAGSGSDKSRCIKIAETYSLNNIKFIDVSPAEVPALQAQADVLLLPLKKGIAATALPSKLTAYMFSAKPIIASVDTPSEVAEIIKNSSCGWVTPSEDIEQLTEAMVESVSIPKIKMTEMGKRALAFAKCNLSQQFNLSKLSEVIIECRRAL